ncbi:MAG: VOC family protein [Clostridia bacterium]|nr:VOC family protein [Clostridia bacterium]
MSIKFCSSVLLVKDIKLSRDFYEGLLQQLVEIDHGECIVFVGGFSIWDIEHAYTIMLRDALKNIPNNKINPFELYFESDDLDNILNKFTSMEIEFVHSLFEQPWGQRVFRVYDPDRNIVEIGEPMTAVIKRYLNMGMSLDEVAKRTSMPYEIVQREASNLGELL